MGFDETHPLRGCSKTAVPRSSQFMVELAFIVHPDEPLAFEIGNSASHHRRGIKAFEARFPRFEGRCYLVSPDVSASLPEENWDRVGTLPIDLFLIAVGAQMEKELARRISHG
jgi:hypothetical protein